MRQPATRLITSVLLAGTLRPTPLQEALGEPMLALPLGRPDGTTATALECWLDALASIDAVQDVRIVVNAQRDVERVEKLLDRRVAHAMRTIAEPAAWRGAGGLVRDVTHDLPHDAIVIVSEASAVPPATLAPLVAALQPPNVGVIGVAGAREPAGVYAFTNRALGQVPGVGYHDLKEQLLPALAANDLPVVAARLGECVLRLRDRRGYLQAIRATVRGAAVSPSAQVQAGAVLDGTVVIGRSAIVESDAIVHDSVVMDGARIERGAVVTRSVIGPGAVVGPDQRVIREVRSGVALGAAERGRVLT